MTEGQARLTFSAPETSDRIAEALFNGKYEEDLRQTCLDHMRELAGFASAGGSVLGKLLTLKLNDQESPSLATQEWIPCRLHRDSPDDEKLEVSAFLMCAAYEVEDTRPGSKVRHQAIMPFAHGNAVEKILDELPTGRLSMPAQYMYLRALCWRIRRIAIGEIRTADLQKRIIEMWIEVDSNHIRRQVSWLLQILPLADRPPTR